MDVPALPWTAPDDVCRDGWMGLDWSTPIPLGERTNVSPPGVALYRCWDDREGLVYVGETTGLRRRLYAHEGRFGESVRVSWACGVPLGEKAKRLALETELIGAHFLAVGTAPRAQFG